MAWLTGPALSVFVPFDRAVLRFLRKAQKRSTEEDGVPWLVDAGVDYFIVSIPRVAYDQEPLQRFAQEIMPQFRS